MEAELSLLEKSFTSCKFAPSKSSKITTATTNATGSSSYNTTSFFIDSSGRSSFTLPLEIKFATKQGLDDFLVAKCLDPSPSNLISDPTTTDDDVDKTTSTSTASSILSFEVKSLSVDDTKEVAVEGVTILSSMVHTEDLIVSFQVKVTVRAEIHDDSISSPSSPVAFSSSPRGTGGVGGAENFNFKDDNQLDMTDIVEKLPKTINVVTNLQIIPVLTMQRKPDTHTGLAVSNNNNDGSEDIIFDLTALELAAIPDQMQKSTTDRTVEARLSPLGLTLTLTHAFTISVKSVPGPHSHMGNTMVSLTIQHSNSHSESVSITNIALHPGHSRQDESSSMSASDVQPAQSVSKYYRLSKIKHLSIKKEINVIDQFFSPMALF